MIWQCSSCTAACCKQVHCLSTVPNGQLSHSKNHCYNKLLIGTYASNLKETKGQIIRAISSVFCTAELQAGMKTSMTYCLFYAPLILNLGKVFLLPGVLKICTQLQGEWN